jgi:hypothetical protein
MMPEKSREFIQAAFLGMCRQRHGYRHLQRVLIGRIKPRDSGPNWEVLAFEPELPQAALAEATKAIAILRATWALAPPDGRRPPLRAITCAAGHSASLLIGVK